VITSGKFVLLFMCFFSGLIIYKVLSMVIVSRKADFFLHSFT
jgi:hypothetical protein